MDGDNQLDLEEFMELVRSMRAGDVHEGPLEPTVSFFLIHFSVVQYVFTARSCFPLWACCFPCVQSIIYILLYFLAEQISPPLTYGSPVTVLTPRVRHAPAV